MSPLMDSMIKTILYYRNFLNKVMNILNEINKILRAERIFGRNSEKCYKKWPKVLEISNRAFI